MCWGRGGLWKQNPCLQGVEGADAGRRTCMRRALWRCAYVQGTKVDGSRSHKELEKNRSHQRWLPGRAGLERSWRPVRR